MMLTKEQVIELLSPVKDPFLHRTLGETGGILDISIREEKKNVSVRIGIAKPNTAEQMQLQQELVGILKKNGMTTVGLRFTDLPEETIRKFQPAQEEEEGSILNSKKQPHFITIASGKGGVGK